MKFPIVNRACIAAVLALSLTLTGCKELRDLDSLETVTVVVTETTHPHARAKAREVAPKEPVANPSSQPPVAGPAEVGSLRVAVARIESQYRGQAGLSFTAPHSGGSEVLGSLTTGPAWSTSKVPIAIARNRIAGVDNNVVAAITASDNQAAAAMWSSLGDPITAGNLANQVLRDGGDGATVMETNYIRAGFSSFGQTVWNLRDQAIFGANLQCISGSREVVNLMGQIVPGQSYGLGNIPGAHFKGGWGPGQDGLYLARQFGFIPGKAPGTFVGVAIAAKPGDGSYASAKAMLNQLARSLSSVAVDGGTC